MKAFHRTGMKNTQNRMREEPVPIIRNGCAEYEVRVASRLSEQWAEWFEGLEISYDDQGNTIFSGAIADQAALHGLLNKIRDLNLTLISITRK